MTPNELSHELEKIYGTELKAVVLYGSAASGDYSKRFSDFNVFCVLENPTPSNLAKSNKLVRKWVKKGNPPPHFFGPRHIETSLDVFPLEFLDIKDQHRVLLGKDPLADIQVDPKNLRHQCESELKGKLIHLRAFYAQNCDRPKVIANMMIQSFSTFLAVFKGVLRLLDVNPRIDARAVVEALAQQIGINPQIFLDIIEIRRGRSYLPRDDDALTAFERYLTEIATIITYVDKLRTSDTRLQTPD